MTRIRAMLALVLLAMAPGGARSEEAPPDEIVEDQPPGPPDAPQAGAPRFRGLLLPDVLTLDPLPQVPVDAILNFHRDVQRALAKQASRTRNWERRQDKAEAQMRAYRASGWVIYSLASAVEISAIAIGYLFVDEGPFVGTAVIGTAPTFALPVGALLVGMESVTARKLASQSGVPLDVPELAIAGWTATASGFALGVVAMSLGYAEQGGAIAPPTIQSISYVLLTAGCILFSVDAATARARVAALGDETAAAPEEPPSATLAPVAVVVPGGGVFGLAGRF
jgi:hypothetical protein